MSSVDLSFSLIFAPFTLSLMLNLSNYLSSHAQRQIEWHVQIFKVLKCQNPHFLLEEKIKRKSSQITLLWFFFRANFVCFKQKYIIYNRFKAGSIFVMRGSWHIYFLGGEEGNQLVTKS